MKIKGLPTEYIGDETFIVDSEQRYNFGAEEKEEYVIITKKDYDFLKKFEKSQKQDLSRPLGIYHDLELK